MMFSRPGFLNALAHAAVLSIACPPAMAQEAMLQCVPYARQVSGIQIYGDAHSWWQQADGRYSRGNRPAPGAVLAFKPHRSMQLGHVAAVSKIIDSRRVLLDHANWSPINGRKGQIERDVLAEDVSAANDWSEVRVWYTPIGGLGTTRYPVHGFIYPQGRAPSKLQTAPVQIAANGQATRELTRDERKTQRQAERQAEKDARKQLRLIEKQRREYAKYLKERQSARRDTARMTPPPLPRPEADPIGDLIGRIGG